MIPEIAQWIWLNETLPLWAAANIDAFRCLHPEWTIRKDRTGTEDRTGGRQNGRQNGDRSSIGVRRCREPSDLERN